MSLSDDGKWIWDEQDGEWVSTIPSIDTVQPSTKPANPATIPLNPPATVSTPNISTGENKMNNIDEKKWLLQSIVVVIMAFGFIGLIFSESYSYSSSYTPGPEPPDTISSSDFDMDGNGLNQSEQLDFDIAMDRYNDEYDAYLEDVEDHNTLMAIYHGKAIFWSNIAPGFIVAGLVCLTFQAKAVKMTNSIRLTLLIGTLYLVANMLGYDMPGVAGDVSLGFGG